MRNWLIQYWLAALFGAIVAVLSGAIKHVWGRQKAQQTEQEAVKSGVVALLHSEIYKEYGLCDSKGFATVDDIKNLEYLYRPYHALGGNGTGTELFERVKNMPGKPAERG